MPTSEVATQEERWFGPSVWENKLFYGKWVPATQSSPVLDKATSTGLGNAGLAIVEDVAVASKACREAQWQWAELPSKQRADVLQRALTLLQSNSEDFIYWLMRETGATRLKAQVEMAMTAGELENSIRMLLQSPQSKILRQDEESCSTAERNPIGTVGIITPFNFPLILGMRSIAPALGFGNAVMLKPDPQTAVSGGLLFARLFESAGLPHDLLHVLPGGAAVGEALVSDPNVDMISFTGSCAVGKAIGAKAGGMLKRVLLELGGNSPFIVLEDADVDRAAAAGAFGSFIHQGQVCMASSRHLVHESIRERYAKKLAEIANSLTVGDPFTTDAALGPLINEHQRDKVHQLVQDAIQAGAKLEAGGEYSGLFYRPTVLSGVTPTMPVFSEEIFGPVAPVTTFGSDEEAIELANRTEYGLAAAIHSGSLDRARAVARKIRVGMVHINDQTVNCEATAPFGGLGVSGNGGRSGGESIIDEYTVWHWTTERREPKPYCIVSRL